MSHRNLLFLILGLALMTGGNLAAHAEDESPDPAFQASASAPKKPAKRRSLLNNESEKSAEKRRLVLPAGEDKTVDIEFEPNTAPNGIAIANPTVVRPTIVKVGDKNQIVFTPLKQGETTILVRDQDGNIRVIFSVRVTPSNSLRTASEIRNLLRDVEGLDIRVVGEKVVVEGEVLVPVDYGRVYTIIHDKIYESKIIDLVRLSPIGMQVISKKIQDDVNVFAPNVKTRVVNGRIFLEGNVDSIDQAKQAVRVAALYLPDVRPLDLQERGDNTPVAKATKPEGLVVSFIVVNPPPPKKQEKLVRITVHYVELSKDYNKLFGFSWQPGFTSDPTIAIGQTPNGTGTGANGPSFSATISSLLPKLNSAQNAGYARVLRTGSVIVRSGQRAQLNENEDIPFIANGPNGSITVAQQSVGFQLAVTPRILGQSDDIQLDLDMNQSNVTGRTPSGGVTTSNHKVTTNVYVKSSESAAVAGVQSSDVGTSFNKDAPSQGSFQQGQNGSTDPLFSLVHSKNYTKKKSQFVIFVTPQIVDNASEGTEDLKKNFRIKVK